jgi:small-conductance mechanosensitive channel
MQIDQFLVQFASTLGALILMLIALAAIVVVKDRRVSRSLVLAVLALALFLITRFAVYSLGERAPMAVEAMRVAGLVFFAFALVRILGVAIVDVVMHQRTGVETPRIIRDMVLAGLYLVATISVLRLTLKIDLTSFLTTAGILSIVLGLALQDTLGNLFSGLAVQIERPFTTGDWITFGENTGRVVELGWRATTILTRSEDLVIVPNNVLTKLELTNHTRPTKVSGRIQEIGLSYHTPPSMASKVILDTLTNVPGVLAAPPPGVRVHAFGDFQVVYRFNYFVADFPDAPGIESAVFSALWYALKRHGIEIPFPIRHVYTHEAGSANGPLDENVFSDAEGLLKEVDFLTVLDEQVRRGLARRMKAVTYGKSETVVRAGDTGELFYLIYDGEVAVRAGGKDVATLARGQFFGEMSLLTGEPRSATVVAKSDTLLLTLDRQGFREVLLAHPDIATKMADLLAARSSALAAAAASGGEKKDASRKILGKLKELFKL